MTESRYWAVIPAAGSGRRMGADTPKQFMRVGGRMIVEHSLQALASLRRIRRAVLVCSDCAQLDALGEAFDGLALGRAQGGAERCHSVLNGLDALRGLAGEDDWVMVHDAARPCVRNDDLQRLCESLATHACGGLLGVPVSDTMKRSSPQGTVLDTENRDNLWHAQTPQMFRYGLLREALAQALADDYQVTDESSAMEHAGHQPLMVAGHADNLKVTRPEDLSLAEYYLRQQGRI